MKGACEKHGKLKCDGCEKGAARTKRVKIAMLDRLVKGKKTSPAAGQGDSEDL